MKAFEIVQLVGISIALIVGVIVFLVVFFRGMSWLDHWIKNRNDSGLNRSGGKGRKRPRRSVSSDWDSFVRDPKSVRTEVRKLSPSKMPPSIPKHLPTKTATTELRSDLTANVQTLASGTPPGSEAVAVDESATKGLRTATEVFADGPELVSKSVNRIATVFLVSGETMERVAFCSRDRVKKICERLGFEGVVFENDEGQIWVVRESNIKLVTWKTSQASMS